MITVHVCSVEGALRFQAAFREAVKSFPEFLPGARRFVLGSFGALGNPASFHHPIVRRCRVRCMRAAVALFRHHLHNGLADKDDFESVRQRRLELLWDRMCWRIPGDTMTRESAHRDVAAHALPVDEIFGGWLNLDEHVQNFHCVPGTQVDAISSHSGFCRTQKNRFHMHEAD